MMVTDLPLISDPLSGRIWVGFPNGQMLPSEAVMGHIRDTYQDLPDEQLVGAAKLVSNITDQQEQILKAERDNQEGQQI